MLKIRRIGLDIEDAYPVVLHKDAELLSVQIEDGTPTLHALDDDHLPEVTRWFRSIPVGEPIRNYKDILWRVGMFVYGDETYHLFEVEKP